MKKFFLLMLLVLFLSSCETSEPLKLSPPLTVPKNSKSASAQQLQTIQQTQQNQTRQEPSFEEITLPKYETKLPQQQPLPQKVPIDPKTLVNIKAPVLVNVDNMPLSDFIIYVMGETLKVTFFMSDDIMKNKTPVTLKMETKLPPTKLFQVALGILERQGIEAEQKNGALYLFTKTKTQISKPVGINVGYDVPYTSADIIQVIPLKYVKATEIESLVNQLYKNTVNLKVYSKENVLVCEGAASSIKEVADFVKLFDVPYLANKKVMLTKLIYWDTDSFIKQLTSIFEGLGFPVAKTPKEPGIYFIPIKYLNSFITVAPDETALNYVILWTKKLDTAESSGTEEKAFVYTPKFSKASDLLDALKQLFAPSQAPSKAVEQLNPQAQARPQSQQTTQPKSSFFSSEGIKMAADDKRNLLLVMCTPSVYKNLLIYLNKLDVAPMQVLITATIAELSLTDELQYGFQWLINSTMFNGHYSLGTNLGVQSSAGLTYQFLSDTQKVQLLLNALETKNLVNILSTPRLMVLDNQEATIQVGTDVPILTGQVATTQSAGTNATGVVQSIQYRATGVILKVKPTINTEGLLTMDITQEVSEMGSNPPGISSPSILERKIHTSVVATSGQSIVLGGLISENNSNAANKVPLLGDIPILGNLFKSKTISKRKTELIVILTPTILSTPEQATSITDEIKKEFKWLK